MVSRGSSSSVSGHPGSADWSQPPRALLTAPPLRHVRGSLIASSLRELEERGLLERYRRVLDPSAEFVLFGAVADKWLPLGVCMAHFRACDEVVPAEVALEIGAATGRRVQASIVSTLLSVATGAGVTPWSVFAHYPRMWSRVFDGGAASVTQAGPKDAVVQFAEFPFARFAYFRHAFRGTHESMLRMFTKAVFVSEVPQHTTSSSFRYSIAWA